MKSDDKNLNINQDAQISSADIMQSLFDQATRFNRYASLYTNYKGQVERKKVLNELLYAEIDIEVRTNPEEFGLGDLLTVKSIEAAIKTDQRYEDAIKEYFDLNDLMHKYDAAKKTMEQRSYMLSNIVKNLATGVRSIPNVILDENKVKSVAKDDMEKSQIDYLNQRQRKESK